MSAGAAAGAADARSSAFTKPALVATFAIFVASGGSVSLYGPSLDGFARTFGTSLPVVGALPPIGAVASLAGVGLWGALDDRVSPRRVILAGGAAFVAGAFAFGVAPNLAVGALAALLVGGGFGAVDGGLNTLLARDPRFGSASLLNALHASFGAGAIAFPLLLSVAGYRWSYVACAVTAVIALPALAQLRTLPPPTPQDEEPGGERERRRSRRRVLAGFLVLYVAYLGIEAGASTWLAPTLIDRGASVPSAARWTSTFWLVFTLTRFATVPISRRVSPDRLVTVVCVLAVPVALTTAVVGVGPWSFVALGALAAPIFPTGLVWLARALPTVRRGTAYVMMAGGVGAAVIPSLISLGVGLAGFVAVTAALVSSAGITATATAVIHWRLGQLRRAAPADARLP